LPVFLRLVRLAKALALVAIAWTSVYATLIVGWQIRGFFATQHWPTLPLSYVVYKIEHEQDATYTTASFFEPDTSAAEALLRVPVVAILLFAAALLILFYLWLARAETRHFAD
jgi:hypothetical protein